MNVKIIFNDQDISIDVMNVEIIFNDQNISINSEEILSVEMDDPHGPQGIAGQDGVSPTVSVIDITGGHRVSITDAQGSKTFDVMDGDDYTLTAQDKQDIAELVNAPVDDVQVDGISVLSNRVAEIPKAQWPNAGVVKVSSDYGIAMNSVGTIYLSQPNDEMIKDGANVYRSIKPSNQHKSVFYGLAKAAGEDMASSENTVGSYTQEAKAAIQNMLGIYSLFNAELIADETLTEDAVRFTVNRDMNGQPFKIRKGIIIVDAPDSLTGNRDYISAICTGFDTSVNASRNVQFPTLAWATAQRTINYYEFELIGNSTPFTKAAAHPGWGRTSNGSLMVFSNANPASYIYDFYIKQYSATHSLIPAGTRILIYGIRV